jgi:predicted nucleotidyltransferase
MSADASEASVDQFLGRVAHWASEHSDIQAVALVGSHARGTATDTSDVDLVLLADAPRVYLDEPGWAGTFGSVVRHETEHYGNLISLRVHYANGLEVEFGLANASWAAVPLDPGTRQVVAAGIKVLFERQPLLSAHVGVPRGSGT